MMKKQMLAAMAAAVLGAFALNAWAAPAVPMGAHHAKMKCETCHTKNNAVKGNVFVPPSDKTCEGCHGSYASLAKKTAGGSEPNPHYSAHYGESLSCSACHRQHEKPQSYCNNCHDFKHKMP